MMVFVVYTPQDYTALLYVSDTLTDRVTLFTQLDLRLVYTRMVTYDTFFWSSVKSDLSRYIMKA